MKIILSNGMTAQVDEIDFEYTNGYSWHHNGAGYAYANLYGADRAITLHHLIAIRIGLNLNFKIDHADRDPLNCCRGNLREATDSQNGANTKLRSDNTSGYRGVSWSTTRNKWWATLTIKGHLYNLGGYTNIHDAARAYNQAAIRYFGVFASVNIIEEP